MNLPWIFAISAWLTGGLLVGVLNYHRRREERRAKAFIVGVRLMGYPIPQSVLRTADTETLLDPLIRRIFTTGVGVNKVVWERIKPQSGPQKPEPVGFTHIQY